MKKLIIVWFSALLSVATYAAKLTSDSHTRDLEGSATWLVTYTGTNAELKNLAKLDAHMPQLSLEGEKIEVVNIGDGTYAAKYQFEFSVATSVLLSALGEEVSVSYIGHMQNGQPFPQEESVGRLSLSFTNISHDDADPTDEPTEHVEPDRGDNSDAEIPATTHYAKTYWFKDENGNTYAVEGPVEGGTEGPANVQVSNVPAPPTKAVSRSLALYTSRDLDDAREAAAKEAAETAYEQGIASVLSNPEAHGLNIDKGSPKPFIKGWCYVEALEWIFVSEDLFPFMYSEKLKSWVLAKENKEDITYFIYRTQTWMTYNEMISSNL